MADFISAYGAGVSTGHFSPCAVVLKYAVGVEALREGYFGDLAVGGHADGKHGAVERAGVYDFEQGDTLAPYLNHRAIESCNITPTLCFGIMLGIEDWGMGIVHYLCSLKYRIMEYQYRFEKLNVYTEARKLVVLVYQLLKSFPREEIYGLCDQLRRAAVSVPSNIAEGTGRFSVKEQIHFLEISYGSLMEVYCQLDIAQDLGYADLKAIKPIKTQIGIVAKLLSGYRNSLVNRPQ